MKSLFHILVLGILVVMLTGCEMIPLDFNQSSKPPKPSQATKIFQAQANLRADLESYNRELSEIKGLLVRQEHERKQKEDPEAVIRKNLKAYTKVLDEHEKRLLGLETQSVAQEQTLKSLASQLKKKTSSRTKSKRVKNPFATAQALFSKKKYNDALFYYQNYLERYPRGKYVANAIYKVALAFEKMGQKSKARIFYKQILDDYSKSQFAKASRKKLKRL